MALVDVGMTSRVPKATVEGGADCRAPVDAPALVPTAVDSAWRSVPALGLPANPDAGLFPVDTAEAELEFRWVTRSVAARLSVSTSLAVAGAFATSATPG